MKLIKSFKYFLLLLIILLPVSAMSAYNLEVPAEPWDEYRFQFKTYSNFLLSSYDKAFVDNYKGAITEVEKAIALLPEEGIGYAERARYNRMLGNKAAAEKDFQVSLRLFAAAIDKYKPGFGNKSKKSALHESDPAEAIKLISMLRYQRGEAYYNFEQYSLASEDFTSSCQGGNSVACSKMWDLKAIERRGVQWVPLVSRHFYDRTSVEYLPASTVRVWVRREDKPPVPEESGGDSYVQQLLELSCSTNQFRLLEAISVFKGSTKTSKKVTDSVFTKPVAGTAPSKLVNLLCFRPSTKRVTPDVPVHELK